MKRTIQYIILYYQKWQKQLFLCKLKIYIKYNYSVQKEFVMPSVHIHLQDLFQFTVVLSTWDYFSDGISHAHIMVRMD